jgi:hypothetical protein
LLCSLHHPSCSLRSFRHLNPDSLLHAWTAFKKLQALLCPDSLPSCHVHHGKLRHPELERIHDASTEAANSRGSNFCFNRGLQRPRSAANKMCGLYLYVQGSLQCGGCCLIVVFCRICCFWWWYAVANATTFASIRCNVEWPQSTANKSYVVCTWLRFKLQF